MSDVLQRFFESAECRTQAELATFLGIRQSSVSVVKRRGTIPAEWLLTLWRKKGINPDWVMAGKGKKFLYTSGSTPTTQAASKDTGKRLTEYSAQELVSELVRRSIALE